VTQALPIIARREFRPPTRTDPRIRPDHKERRLISKLVTEKEAVTCLVSDGDQLAYDLNIASAAPLRSSARSSASARKTCG
jgi:hypothetical protein